MTIEEYFGDWSRVINLKEADAILKSLSPVSSQLCPKLKDIFKAFHLCPLKNLRTIILGQDPYSNLRPLHYNSIAIKKGSVCCNTIATKVPVATGVAFANAPDTPESSYSPSLKVLMESVIDFTIPHNFINFDGSLEKWEKQGVLMLNSALSCLQGRTGIHSLLWRPFIKSLLTNLSLQTTGIVYVLMGSDAQSFEPYINPRFNHILKTHHPSYYARTQTKMPSDIWQQVNQILIGQNGYGIQWYEEESSVC